MKNRDAILKAALDTKATEFIRTSQEKRKVPAPGYMKYDGQETVTTIVIKVVDR